MDYFNFQINQFSTDTRYLFSVGRIRVMENQLIPFQKFNRMAERQDWQGVLDELRSTEYYEKLISVKNARMLEDAISSVLNARQKIIRELSVDAHLIDAILLRHDFNNLKALLREQCLSQHRAFPLSHLGIIDPARMENLVKNQQPLPSPLQEGYLRVQEDYQRNHSIFRVEMLLDKTYLENIKNQFLNSGIPYLKEFIAYRIDWLNVLQVLRWRQWQPEHSIEWELLAEGGYLDRDRLQKLLTEPLDRLPTIMQYTLYGEAMIQGLEYFRQSNQLWKLEKLGEDFLTAFCKLTRYTNAGVEPLIAYIWVSVQELKNLHMILITKYMGLSPDIVKTRIRTVYE